MGERTAASLPKSRRLRKRREFLSVQQAGSRITLPSCLLLMVARSDEAPARLGITVTRKYGNAVRRNRAKRLFREAFRQLPGLFPKGIDLVVIPKASNERPLELARIVAEWRGAGRLIGARAESLRRALANSPPGTQTAPSKGPTG